jgi:PAS domain S-box-containing protein
MQTNNKGGVIALAQLMDRTAKTPYYFIAPDKDTFFLSQNLQQALSASSQWIGATSFLAFFDKKVNHWIKGQIPASKVSALPEGYSTPIKDTSPPLKLTSLNLTSFHLGSLNCRIGLLQVEFNLPEVITTGYPLAPEAVFKQLRFGPLIDSGLSGIFFTDTNQRRSYISPAFNTFRGYSAETVPIPWEESILEQDMPLAMAYLEKIAQDTTGQPHKAIFRHQHQAGHIAHIMAVAQCRTTFDGSPSGEVFGLWVDVTEQEELKNKLEVAVLEQQATSDYLERLLNGVPEAIVVLDQHTGTIMDCNEAAADKFGYSKQALIGKHHSILQATGQDNPISQTLERQSNISYTYTFFRHDGSSMYLRLTYTEAQLKGKAVYIMTFADITEIIKARKKLKQQESLYRQLIQYSSEYITIMRPDFTVLWSSDNFSKLLGVPQKQLLGKQLNTFAHPEDNKRVKAVFKKAMERGEKVINFEGRFHTAKGEYIWMKSKSVLLTDEQGEQRIYTYRQDISQEKAIADEQIEISRLKSEFVSMTSHQLRTPIAVFASNLELLDGLLNEEHPAARRILTRLQKESDRMVHLLDEVLLISRLESGRLEQATLQKLDLVSVIRNFCENGMCSVNQVRTVLPEEPVYARLDKSQFEHILMNLISNALKYTPKDHPKPELILRVDKERSEAIIVVRDYGIGIPKEDQSKLFRQFFRAKNTVNIPGTGLGLYVVNRFAAQNNIRINLDSQIKQGTRIELIVPTL